MDSPLHTRVRENVRFPLTLALSPREERGLVTFDPVQREIGNMARKKNDTSKAPAQPASVFEGLLFVAVAATVVAILFLVLSLSRYEWALSS